MKWVLGIPLLLLVLPTKSTRPDDLEWNSTRISVMVTLTSVSLKPSMRSAEPATSSAAPSSTSVGTTAAQATTARRKSSRLPDPIEEEAPDYCDGETQVVVSGGDGPHPASDIAQGERSAERPGRGDVASRGNNAAPSGSSATVGRGEDSGAGAAVEDDAPPEAVNWISWLPSWRRYWLRYSSQLQTFSEALTKYTAGIDKYWVQTENSTDTDQRPSNEEPHTDFISNVMQRVQVLQRKWVYYASDHLAASLESICNWLPTMCFTCTTPDSGILRDFFSVTGLRSTWNKVFDRWASSQYSLTAGPRNQPRWWLLSNLHEDIPPFNVSHSSTRNQAAEASASRVEAVSIKDARGERKRDLTVRNGKCEAKFSEATAHRNSCSSRQFEPQHSPLNQEGRFASCVLQCRSMRGNGNGQPLGTERIPMRDTGTGTPLKEVGDELGAESARPHNGVNGCGGLEDVNPDNGFYEFLSHVLHLEEQRRGNVAVKEQEEEQVTDSSPQQMAPDSRNIRGCIETPVFQELGAGFDPYYLFYVTCNRRDEACHSPEKCTPVSSVVTVVAPLRAIFPEFPHTLLDAKQMPDGRIALTLLVATSCACRQPLEGN